MKLEDLSPELQAESFGKSPAELMELAEKNGIELSHEDLDQISGGEWLPSPALEKGCPKCGSLDVHVSSIGQTMLYQCNKCGHKWM